MVTCIWLWQFNVLWKVLIHLSVITWQCLLVHNVCFMPLSWSLYTLSIFLSPQSLHTRTNLYFQINSFHLQLNFSFQLILFSKSLVGNINQYIIISNNHVSRTVTSLCHRFFIKLIFYTLYIFSFIFSWVPARQTPSFMTGYWIASWLWKEITESYFIKFYQMDLCQLSMLNNFWKKDNTI